MALFLTLSAPLMISGSAAPVIDAAQPHVSGGAIYTTFDRHVCFRDAGQAAIAACTHLLASGEFTGSSLAGIYFTRGVSWYELHEYDRAIEDYDRAISVDPGFVQAILNRANANGEKGAYDRAIQDYTRAIELDPTYAKAFNNRGYAYDDQQDYDHAIKDFSRAIELSPNYAQAFNNRAVAYRKNGDIGRAIQDFDKAIALRPDYADAFFNRGNAYEAAQDYQRAIQEYDQAIKIDPTFALAFYIRGIAKLRIGDAAGGSEDIAAANAMRPDITTASDRSAKP